MFVKVGMVVPKIQYPSDNIHVQLVSTLMTHHIYLILHPAQLVQMDFYALKQLIYYIIQ